MNRSNHQKEKASTTRLLILSLVVNGVLAAAAVKLLWKPAPPPAAPATHVVTVAVEAQPVAAVDPPASPVWVTNQFHWRQVESTNYEDYVSNLRAIGCPEKTLGDIVVADVIRHYAARQRNVRTERPFWMGGRKLKAAERAEAAQLDALEKEQAALLQRLLGSGWPGLQNTMGMDRFEDQALVRFLMGPMEDDTLWRTLRVGEKYEGLKKALDRRTGDILTDADETEVQALAAGMRREMQALLTPAQWEEMAARMSDNFLKGNLLQGMDVSPAEARRIALARSGNGTTFDFFGNMRNEAPDEKEVRERQFTNSVAQVLGEKRFAEFERAQDYKFRELFELAQANNLSKETAVQVYDIRRLAADEVRQVRADDALNEAARRQKFEQMQSALQRAVSDALGTTVYQEYLKREGAWITNVTKL